MIKDQLTIDQLLQKKALIPARQTNETPPEDQEFDQEMCHRIDRIIKSLREQQEG